MAQEIYDELVAAGAPALPPNHFYRVKPLFGFDAYVDVQVRRRSSFWLLPSRKAGAMATTVDDTTRTELQAIVWAARHAYKEATRGRMPFERFLGDHP